MKLARVTHFVTIATDRIGMRGFLFRICALFACSFVFPPASSGGVVFLRLFMIKPFFFFASCVFFAMR